MGNSKNIIIIVLVVALIALAGWTYYTLTVSVPKKAEAECKANIDTQVIPQVKAAAQAECEKVVQDCQQAVTQFMQIPACVSALSQ
jgi:predicted negative regulator of RcsB-dependent stress response